ncbi:facilitated trehalose transporter Tret1-like [Rhipicephalus sanguineus]|uniref:facilitated trehalose transporter Tret1-like n=1 Tax=Rhipicephalus sanguineus TaxID=34632 RepID=UPI001895EA6F|nr:facilitated trehalose transporter Tret1-like [Rhipicephalus sanguineus]
MFITHLGRRFSSTLPLGAVVGSLGAGSLCHWLWLHSAESTASLYSAHLTVGLSVGVASISASAYMVEMAAPGNRGILALNRIGISSVHVDREARHIEEAFTCLPPTAVNVLLVHHLMFVQQFSGIAGAPPYIAGLAQAVGVALSQPAFTILLSSLQGGEGGLNAVVCDLNPWLSHFVNSCTLVMTVFCAAVMDVLGRRKLVLLSAAACVCSLFAVGAVSSWGREKEQCPVALGIELAFLVVYAIGYSIGLGPVTWLLAAEMRPAVLWWNIADTGEPGVKRSILPTI